jgi:hypothetical protein
MKKLMFGMVSALALCGLADIESSNIVGYQTKNLEAGKFAIAAIQFEGTDGSMDIGKLISGFSGVSYEEYGDDFVNVAPQLQVPNGVGYDIYYYLTDGWFDDGTEAGGSAAGWCDQFGVLAGKGAEVSGELVPGVAMWVKSNTTTEVYQQSGQVSEVGSITIDVPTTFALRASFFPIAFNLNDATKVSFEGLVQASYEQYGDDFVSYASQLQVPNGIGYDVYYYLTDGWFDDGTEAGGSAAGWCDQFGVLAGKGAEVSGDVPAGQGFWAKGVGSTFKMTFKK